MISIICDKLNKSNFFNYYIVTPWIYAIGTCSEHINIANRISSFKKKEIIVIKLSIFQKLLNYHVCNHDLFDNLDFGNKKNNKILKTILTILINLEFFFIRIFVLLNDKTLNLKLPEYIRFPQIGIKEVAYNNKYLFKKDFNKIKPYPNYSTVKLNSFKSEQNKKIFDKTFNITNNKIVCLHVRDPKYRSDSKKRIYRNSKVDTYIPAIEYLIKKNYVVVRLGDKKKDKINFSHQNFIDLYDHKHDIYLINSCSFFIGTLSGPMDVSYLFQKPTLLTNVDSMYIGFPRNFKDRVIFKKAVLNNKEILLNEHLDLPFSYHNYLEQNKNLNFIDNTPNEILEATKEFVNNLEKNNFDKTIIQKKFNDRLKKKMQSFFSDDSSDNSFHKHPLAINFIRWAKTQQGAACNFILNKEFKEN